MRRLIHASVLAAALLDLACASPRSASGSAASGASSAPAASTSSPQVAAKDRLICRYERPTGSNIPERICYTQEQLDEMSRAAQDAARRSMSNATQSKRD
jgi:hypothetical protein